MTREKLKEIIKQGEGLEVEFKTATFGLNKDAFDSICGFLNRMGGHLLLGIKDNGRIEGVIHDCVPDIVNNITTSANNPQKLNPPFYLSPEVFEIEGKQIIYLRVPESSLVHSTNGKIFDRNQDGDFDITRHTDQVTQLYIKKQVIDPENFSPFPKNPVIAKFFHEIGGVDELGSGIRNTFRYCRIYTPGNKPEFIEGDVFKTIIPLRATQEPRDIPVNDWPQVRAEIRRKFGEKFGDSSEKIVELIFSDSYMSAASIAEKVNLSSRAVEKQIAKLRELGIIQRIGAAKGGYWKILAGTEN